MTERPKIDRSIVSFRRSVREIGVSNRTVPNKLKAMGKVLGQRTGPLQMTAEDGLISKMSLAAQEEAASIVRRELERIKGLARIDLQIKMKKIDALSKEIETTDWLTNGFKAGLSMECAAAKSDLYWGNE